MDKKYIEFYQNFHRAFDGKSNHCLNLISDGGIGSTEGFLKRFGEK